MKVLYLAAERRERKIVRLYEDAEQLDELFTGGDLLTAVFEILRRNGMIIGEIGKIETAPDQVNSVSGRVANSLAAALKYALNL